MPARAPKQEIVTFKVDPTLHAALAGVANRSEFIRAAVRSALENVCPLCRGRGVLSANQRVHWTALSGAHGLRECDDCHELHLVCHNAPVQNVHR